LIWEREGDLPRLASAAHVRPEALVTVSPELAGLIRQMLSEQPSARGGAAEVARALEHAEKRAGRKANRPITKLRARASTVRAPRPDSLRTVVAWLGWVTAAALGVALAVRAGAPEYEMPVERPKQVTQESGGKDGESAALVEEALSVREGAKQPRSEQGGFHREMPKKPLPGQRRPPCGRHETEIYGGCWAGLSGARPPCDEPYYDWKEGCFLPVPALSRPPTSEQP
jgi:hypothetical protein